MSPNIGPINGFCRSLVILLLAEAECNSDTTVWMTQVKLRTQHCHNWYIASIWISFEEICGVLDPLALRYICLRCLVPTLRFQLAYIFQRVRQNG